MVSPESGILKLDDPDRDRCDDRDFCVVVSAVSYFGAQQRAETPSAKERRQNCSWAEWSSIVPSL